MSKDSRELEKWRALRAAPKGDVESAQCRELAEALGLAVSTLPEHRRLRAYVLLALACARDCVRYETDIERTGAEHLGSPFEVDGDEGAWSRGRDDCDAKARMFVALCLRAGIPAVMMALWEGDRLAHVYARVQLDGEWLPVELTLARAQLGESPQAVPREPATGQWLHTKGGIP